MLCDGSMMGWMWVGGAFWLLLAVVVLLFFVRDGFPGLRQKYSGASDHDQALALLKRRFANGDIDEREFRERLDVLEMNSQD